MYSIGQIQQSIVHNNVKLLSRLQTITNTQKNELTKLLNEEKSAREDLQTIKDHCQSKDENICQLLETKKQLDSQLDQYTESLISRSWEFQDISEQFMNLTKVLHEKKAAKNNYESAHERNYLGSAMAEIRTKKNIDQCELKGQLDVSRQWQDSQGFTC